jgi:hypothetical protein
VVARKLNLGDAIRQHLLHNACSGQQPVCMLAHFDVLPNVGQVASLVLVLVPYKLFSATAA